MLTFLPTQAQSGQAHGTPADPAPPHRAATEGPQPPTQDKAHCKTTKSAARSPTSLDLPDEEVAALFGIPQDPSPHVRRSRSGTGSGRRPGEDPHTAPARVQGPRKQSPGQRASPKDGANGPRTTTLDAAELEALAPIVGAGTPKTPPAHRSSKPGRDEDARVPGRGAAPRSRRLSLDGVSLAGTPLADHRHRRTGSDVPAKGARSSGSSSGTAALHRRQRSAPGDGESLHKYLARRSTDGEVNRPRTKLTARREANGRTQSMAERHPADATDVACRRMSRWGSAAPELRLPGGAEVHTHGTPKVVQYRTPGGREHVVVQGLEAAVTLVPDLGSKYELEADEVEEELTLHYQEDSVFAGVLAGAGHMSSEEQLACDPTPPEHEVHGAAEETNLKQFLSGGVAGRKGACAPSYRPDGGGKESGSVSGSEEGGEEVEGREEDGEEGGEEGEEHEEQDLYGSNVDGGLERDEDCSASYVAQERIVARDNTQERRARGGNEGEVFEPGPEDWKSSVTEVFVRKALMNCGEELDPIYTRARAGAASPRSHLAHAVNEGQQHLEGHLPDLVEYDGDGGYSAENEDGRRKRKGKRPSKKYMIPLEE